MTLVWWILGRPFALRAPLRFLAAVHLPFCTPFPLRRHPFDPCRVASHNSKRTTLVACRITRMDRETES